MWGDEYGIYEALARGLALLINGLCVSESDILGRVFKAQALHRASIGPPKGGEHMKNRVPNLPAKSLMKIF